MRPLTLYVSWRYPARLRLKGCDPDPSGAVAWLRKYHRREEELGLDTSAVMFLCGARSMGVDFGSTATIGRQALLPDQTALARVFAVLGVNRDAGEFLRSHPYGEELLSLLGATRIESVDVSPYEKATILHDMNLPLPRGLCEQFSLVHDGGTIEHVFNIPQAFKNCMEMVRVGGHFTQVNVANNFAGHGFWQFSPELIFRVFTEANGFELEAVLMHEVIPGGAWYVVADPDDIRQRVELCNDQPTYIFTVARRIASVPVFARPPQQSDYVSLWDRTLNPQPQPAPPSTANAAQSTSWRDYVPESVKRSLRPLIHHVTRPRDEGVQRGFSPRSYRRITEDDVLRGRFSRRE